MPRILIRFIKRVHHQKINMIMKKPAWNGVGKVSLLKDEEMRKISGGSIVSYLVRFAQWGAGYFFRMGVQEGRKMRDQL